MEVVFLLVPMAAALAFGVVGALVWAVRNGQFDDLEGEGHRILLEDDAPPPDPRAAPGATLPDRP
jgi:cbb3-type cytochrome oxidase maturation protein